MEDFDYIEPGYIIRNVSQTVGDPEFKSGLTRGWYITQLANCLDEVGYDMPFKPKWIDLEIGPGKDIDPTILQFQVPKQIWNIDQIYVWNGECCSPNCSQAVYWKRQYHNGRGGPGYTATRKDSTNGDNSIDPFLPMWEFYTIDVLPSNVYWFNVQNGVLMVSPSCGSWQKLRIVYYGTYGDVGSAPIIPRYFGKLMEDWNKWKWLDSAAIRNPGKGYQGLALNAKDEVYNMRTGSWWSVMDRVSRMSNKERSDFATYLNMGNW